MPMNVQLPISDNISEVLVKIIQFTELRRQILHRNMHNLDTPQFVPQDLPVREFAALLDEAVAEHLQNHRLVLRDTTSIRFGSNNAMQVHPQTDAHALTLLGTSRDAYLELQVNKLMENSLNRKVAEELLRQKCGTYPQVPAGDSHATLVSDGPSGGLLTHQDTTE
jgi:flagellar basal body rod protein FlgB